LGEELTLTAVVQLGRGMNSVSIDPDPMDLASDLSRDLALTVRYILTIGNLKLWTLSCLRPLPPARPTLLVRDDTKSPKIQRKASTLGRRKNNGACRSLLYPNIKIQVVQDIGLEKQIEFSSSSSIEFGRPSSSVAKETWPCLSYLDTTDCG